MAIRETPYGSEGGEWGGGAWTPWQGESHEPGVRGEGEQRGLGLRAKGLGWFSIGLGLSQVVMPGAVSRFIGLKRRPHNEFLMRALGLRELAAGVGILARERPTTFLWARVIGDLMDLALLGAAWLSPTSDKQRLLGGTTAVLGATALDAVTAAQYTAKARRTLADRIYVTKAITIYRQPDEVYRFFRSLENLPRFMAHLESVQELGENRSRWRANAPAGLTVEWEAEILEDRPSELIGWRSLERSDVQNEGLVVFQPAPGGRGTEVRVELSYKARGGKLGAFIAKLFGEEPSQQIDGDLRRLKQVLETGEVTQSDASIHSRPHAAQPSSMSERKSAEAARTAKADKEKWVH